MWVLQHNAVHLSTWSPRRRRILHPSSGCGDLAVASTVHRGPFSVRVQRLVLLLLLWEMRSSWMPFASRSTTSSATFSPYPLARLLLLLQLLGCCFALRSTGIFCCNLQALVSQLLHWLRRHRLSVLLASGGGSSRISLISSCSAWNYRPDR